MPRHRYEPKHRRARRVDEASNSFALFVCLLPVLIGVFGLGVDASRNVYIRHSIQNALDMATVAGAGVSQIKANGNVVVDETEAIATVEKVYALNRSSGPVLECIGTNARIDGTRYNRCWQQWQASVVNPGYVSYSVKEKSKNAFLSILRQPYQVYTLESHARVKQQGW